MIAQPELFAAFVSLVGFHDTRAQRDRRRPVRPMSRNSAASATRRRIRDLLAMSTYANLRDGVAYPAALFTAGFNDPRVDAWDPGKTAARMQAITAGPGGSGKPVLLRVDFAGGHGSSTADRPRRRIHRRAGVPAVADGRCPTSALP